MQLLLPKSPLEYTNFAVQAAFAVFARCLRLLLMAFGTAQDLYLGQKFKKFSNFGHQLHVLGQRPELAVTILLIGMGGVPGRWA